MFLLFQVLKRLWVWVKNYKNYRFFMEEIELFPFMFSTFGLLFICSILTTNYYWFFWTFLQILSQTLHYTFDILSFIFSTQMSSFSDFSTVGYFLLPETSLMIVSSSFGKVPWEIRWDWWFWSCSFLLRTCSPKAIFPFWYYWLWREGKVDWLRKAWY